MATLEIGQKGKLGNETLTVVSISAQTFTCDNGKMYMIDKASWMTEGVVTEARKEKRARKYNNCPEGFFNNNDNVRNIEDIMRESSMRQRGSSMR